MDRRSFVATLAAASSWRPMRAGAQPAAPVRRIGVLVPSSLTGWVDAPEGGPDTLKRALQALGHVEGRNVAYLGRAAEGHVERLPALAAELVRERVDVIVSGGSEATATAKRATTTIPIVFMGPSYPVEEGLVASLARPGGNVTGITLAQSDHVAKHLQLLRDVAPKLKDVPVVFSEDNRGSALFVRDAQREGGARGLAVLPVAVTRSEDVAAALATIERARPLGAVLVPVPMVSAHLERFVELAANLRMATITAVSSLADRGVLMSYGAEPRDVAPVVARFVDRILRGTRPADLPVEQAPNVQLVLNLRTARAIGVAVPPTVLYRADRVID